MCLAQVLVASQAAAQGDGCTEGDCLVGQHRDVAIAVEVDPLEPEVKKLVPGALDWDAPFGQEDLFFGDPIDSVFRTGTDLLTRGEIFSNTPGFFAADPEEPGLERVEDGTEIAFDVKRIPSLGTNLAYWSGNGAVDFGSVPSCEAIGIQSPRCESSNCPDIAYVEGHDRDEPGFPIASVSEGALHAHLQYFLLGPPSEPTEGCPPASTRPESGIYLWSMALRSDGFEDSDPMFAVLGTPPIGGQPGITEGQLIQAQQWVAANLVPEPAGAPLAAAALAPLAWLAARRRRRAESCPKT
ncbi:MAG: hypothetical protein QNK03_17155 [Myxococcota bacterium]|nr:hypothetical protein [Myxococcota bacterium]